MSEPGEAAKDGETFRVCSICRKAIPFGSRYYQCSVSTCNRSRTALFFCSVPCWDAHLPEARHRDAWAVEARAPTKEQWEQERAAEEAAANEAAERRTPAMDDKTRERKIVSPKSDEVPREVLVVVSKVKAYIKARSGMNTSDAVMEVLSDHVRRVCDLAIDNASIDNRKTVLDRDLKTLLKLGP